MLGLGFGFGFGFGFGLGLVLGLGLGLGLRLRLGFGFGLGLGSDLLGEGDDARVGALGELELLRGVARARGAALAAQPIHRPAAP